MTVRDVPTCIAIGKTLHQESVYVGLPYEPQKLGILAAYCLGADDCFAVVAEQDGVQGLLVAFVQEHFFSYERYASDLVFYLTPKIRSGGTAQRMVQQYVQWAQGKGCNRISLGISSGIKPERLDRFYRLLGFAPTATLYNYRL